MKRSRQSIFLVLAAIFIMTAVANTVQGATGFTYSDGWYAPSKDAAAVLDYSIDWSQWLAGDTIAASSWTCDQGITGVPVSGPDTTKTSIWLSGGTMGQTYKISNSIIQ
jgi:hypothetical protein